MIMEIAKIDPVPGANKPRLTKNQKFTPSSWPCVRIRISFRIQKGAINRTAFNGGRPTPHFPPSFVGVLLSLVAAPGIWFSQTEGQPHPTSPTTNRPPLLKCPPLGGGPPTTPTTAWQPTFPTTPSLTSSRRPEAPLQRVQQVWDGAGVE